MPATGTWVKMAVVTVAMCVGGPALVYYVTPTEEELFKKYNPELQKRSLENRQARQQEFDDYVNKLKEWSRSDKQIWFAAEEMAEKARMEQKDKILDEQNRLAAEVERRRKEMRDSTVK
ncbi:CBP4-domain-containing protein [Viridothelium virens]|uniref:Cytochrome b mRNA-processing protein 4 n=1 Tax=Viridothelium virens TaxID=1048519 RepID=A0A6A6HJ59_VIRVR|nr:CBP4-domain-containing protein [Viridothelium virens]